MISNTRILAKELSNLSLETFLLCVDDEGREYIIESIIKQNMHCDSDSNWCYALKIKKSNAGCIKR